MSKYITPNCIDCGRFVNCEVGLMHFTPDTEFDCEDSCWSCKSCWDKEKANDKSSSTES